MFPKLLTTCCPGLAAALILVTAEGWAQQQDSPVTNDRLDETRSLLPPADIPQPAQINQQEWEQPRQDEGEDLDRQGQRHTAERPLEPNQAPPVPRSDDARYDDRGDVRATAPAELGVYMLPNDGPGVVIGDVFAGTAAEEAGLRPGDYILSINGKGVAGPADVGQLIRSMEPGESVELVIWRDGEEQPITATLGESRRMAVDEGGYYDVPHEEVGYGPDFVVRPHYYRPPIVRRYYSYYPEQNYYYDYPYSYRYYGTPRFGYYRSPWDEGVRVGPFRYSWR